MGPCSDLQPTQERHCARDDVAAISEGSDPMLLPLTRAGARWQDYVLLLPVSLLYSSHHVGSSSAFSARTSSRPPFHPPSATSPKTPLPHSNLHPVLPHPHHNPLTPLPLYAGRIHPPVGDSDKILEESRDPPSRSNRASGKSGLISDDCGKL